MATYYVDGAVGNDANTGTSPGAGNAWATIGKAATTMVAGDTVNIKASATYTITASITPTNSGSSTLPITYSGYTSSPGDAGQITVACSTNSVHMIDLHGKSFLTFRNFILSNTAATPGSGVAATTANSSQIVLDNFIMSGCSSGVFGSNVAADFQISPLFVINSEIKSCSAAGLRICGFTKLSGVYIHGCTDGIFYGNTTSGNFLALDRCIIAANSAIGVHLNYNSATYLLSIVNSVINGNTSDGVNIPTTVGGGGIAMLELVNNIIQSNGGWGVNSAATLSGYNGRNNAYRNNTSGNLNNVAAGFSDVTLTGDPFVNAASGNFALNTTAGAGGACRAAGFLGVFPGGTTTGYLDIGAAQSQATGGTAGMLYVPGMAGGCDG